VRIFVRSLNFFRERSMIYFVRHGKIVFLAIFFLAVFSAVSTLLAVPSNCQNCSYVCGYLSTGVNSKGGDSVCVLTGSVTVSDDVWGMIDFQDGVNREVLSIHVKKLFCLMAHFFNIRQIKKSCLTFKGMKNPIEFRNYFRGSVFLVRI